MVRAIIASVAMLAIAVSANAGQLTIGSGGSLDLGGGSLDLGCADVVVDGTLSAGTGGLGQIKDLSVPSGGTLNGDSAAIEVTGSWTVGGIFNEGTGTVSFVDGCGVTSATISGSNTFNNLVMTTSVGKQVSFEQGETTTVDGSFTLGGASGKLLEIRSTLDGSEAFLDLTQPAAGDFVDVKDNHAVDQLVSLGSNSVLTGNADGWSFATVVPGLSLLGLAVLAGSLQIAARRAFQHRLRETC